MITDTVYDAQGRVSYSDDPHLSGKPADGTHTIYDQAGNVVGTVETANVVISIATAGGVSSSAFSSAGSLLATTLSSYDAAGLRHTDGRPFGHGHELHV